jgi:ribosomal protein S18 acetylase RimI-like enzyme
MTIAYRRNTADCEHVFKHLATCSNTFIPPLEQRVSIGEYAAKLSSRAMLFEAWSNDTLVGLLAAYWNGGEENSSSDRLLKTARGNNEGFITSLSVLSTSRKKGIATKLQSDCIALAALMGISRIRLEVDPRNQAAIRFYLANGFDRVEHEPTMMMIECPG